MKTVLSLQSQLDSAGSGGSKYNIFAMVFHVRILGTLFGLSFIDFS